MKTLFVIPRQPYILACSGGVDSMAALAFLRNGHHDFEVAYFNHGTKHGQEAQEFLVPYCESRGIKIHVKMIKEKTNPKESPEEFFRNERYEFLSSFGKKVITAHHLDDCVETWLFSSIHGNPKLIPYMTPICIRPFLICRKSDMAAFAKRNEMSWVVDESNFDISIPRNYIRHTLIPSIRKLNPNIFSTIRKKILSEYKGI